MICRTAQRDKREAERIETGKRERQEGEREGETYVAAPHVSVAHISTANRKSMFNYERMAE